MRTEKVFGAVLVSFLAAFSVCAGAQLNVGAGESYTTIQSAINDANDFDVVVVAAGVYKENINFGGKAITLRSGDPVSRQSIASTVIDGNFAGSCVVFNTGEGNDSVLDGFTLTNGTGNYASHSVHGTTYNGPAGGGVYCMNSSPTVRRCNITLNGYTGPESSDASAVFGGGIAIIGTCQAIIDTCFVTDNIVGFFGAGIIVLGPTAESACQITNCTVANNRVDFRDNNNRHRHYDIDSYGTRTTISNTIIWSGYNRSLLVTDPSLVSNCCLQSAYQFNDNYPYIDIAPVDLAAQGDNIYGNPRFIRLRESWFDADEIGDYHLKPDSICIDHGDRTFDGAGLEDVDGQSRVMGLAVDIGADEVVPAITLTKPAGGEIWSAGSSHAIEWESSNKPNVFVCNADFEESDISDPYTQITHIKENGNVPGWQVGPYSGAAKTNFDYYPTPSGWTTGFSYGSDLYQTLADVYLPETTYTLTVDVGSRTDWTGEITEWLAAITVDDRDTIVAGTDQTIAGIPEKGGWLKATVTYTTGAEGADPLLGRPIGVLLTSPPRVYWDNVKIDIDQAEIRTVDISYSTDGGNNWNVIESGVGDTGSYNWQLPEGVDSDDCLLKIVPTDEPDTIEYAGFDNAFAIRTSVVGEPLDSAWSTLGGDSKRRGLSGQVGPELGCLKWVQPTAGPVYNGVTVGSQGHIYSVTANGILSAVDSDGNLLWEYALGDSEILTFDSDNVQASPDITGEWDALMVSTSGSYVNLGTASLDITERNDIPVLAFRNTAGGGYVYGTTPIDTESPHIIGVVVPHGAREWSDIQLYIDGLAEKRLETRTGSPIPKEITSLSYEDALIKVYRGKEEVGSFPTVGSDGTIYVGFGDKLYAIGSDGVLKWTHTTGAFIYSCPAVNADGEVFFGSADGNVYALDSDGSELWTFEVPGPGLVGGSVLAPPSIGKDGSVYTCGLYDGNLYALDPDNGDIRWECDFGSEDIGSMITAPVIADDGTIYATLIDDTNLYAIDPNDGSVKWTTDISHEPELVGYWKFDEMAGATIYDSSAYERNGTIDPYSFNEYTWVDGYLGGALRRGLTTVSRFKWDANTTARTICTWVYDRSIDGLGIVNWDHYSSSTDNWNITITSNYTEPSFGVARVDINGGFMEGKTNLRDNKWHHIAIVIDGASMENVRIYVDGALDAEFGDNGGYANNTSSIRIDEDYYGEDLFISGESYYGLPVDDLRLFEVALTAEQIRGLMWDTTAPTFDSIRPVESDDMQGRYSWSEVATAPDGTIYAGFDDPYLRAINPDGTVKWIKHLACGGNYTLAVDNNSNAYAAGADGVLYVIDPDGNLITRFDANSHVKYEEREPGTGMLIHASDECQLQYPVITEDRTVYVADTGSKIWAISTDSCTELSYALACQKLPMDINHDCIVNLADCAIVATDWMACTGGWVCGDPEEPFHYVPGYYDHLMQFLEADLNKDALVDFGDVVEIMKTWLMGSDLVGE